MNFSEEIKQGLLPMINRGIFEIIEERNNFLKLCSNELQFYIAYNELECSSSLSIEHQHVDSFEVRNTLLRDIFGCDIELERVTKDVFIKNIILFLTDCYSKLADRSLIDQCITLSRQRDHDYTSYLIVRQNLNKADKAWSEKNYIEFMKLIDIIPTHELSPSYELKYKIAKKNGS